jgi:acyl-CoA reductase-like NAD-dependent aldehyde dehydrogenase
VDNLEAIAERIRIGGYGNNGESCISVQNIFIHHSLFEKFKTVLTNVVKKIKYGSQFDPNVFVGPLINPNEPKKY